MQLRRRFAASFALFAAMALTLGLLPGSALPAKAAATVVNVADFGADPTGTYDSTQGVAAAIEHAKTVTGPVTLNFPRGTYQMYSDQAAERELYISNTVGANQSHKMKRIALLLEDMDDVTIEGNGSQLVMHGQQIIFAALRSTNSTLRNFTLDWISPRVVDVTVVAAGDGYRDVHIPDGYRYAINGTDVSITSELSPYTGQPYWSYPSLRSVGYSQTFEYSSGRLLRSGGAAGALFSGVTSITEVEPGLLRFHGSSMPLGRSVQIRTTTRDTSGMLMFESTNTTLAGLDLGYLHGFGVVAQMNDGLTVRGVNFRQPGGSWRSTSAFADLIQVSGDKGEVLIEDSTFGFAHDDPINVHGTYVQVEAVNRREVTLKYMHNETAGFPQFYPGNQAMFVAKSTMLEVPDWVGTVVSVDGPSGYDSSKPLTTMKVTFDKDLPVGVTPDQHVVENLTYSPQLTVRGNHFESIPTRGVLVTTRKPVLIENNVFDQMEMASIYISGDANNWYESSVVRDVTIRGNLFTRPGGAAGGSNPVIFVDPILNTIVPTRKAHENITIEDNTFLVGDSTIVDAKSVNGLRILNNTVGRYDRGLASAVTLGDDELAPGETTQATLAGGNHTRPMYVLRGSTAVQISGNVYDDGLNRRVSTTDMAPADLANGDSALAVGTNNTTPQGQTGYESSDPSIATVDANGVVTAKGVGTAEISGWRSSPLGITESLSATVTITEASGPPVPVLASAFDVIRPTSGRVIPQDDASLRLLPTGGSLWATGNSAGNIVALRTPTLKVGESATVTMKGRTQQGWEETGIGLYTNDDNYVLLQRKHADGSPAIKVVTELAGAPDEGRSVASPAEETVHLRLTRTATGVQGSYSLDGTTFTNVGSEVANASITDASRVVLLVAGYQNATSLQHPFDFSNLSVGATEVPLVQFGGGTAGPQSPERPADLPSRHADIATADFQGVTFPGTARDATTQGVVTAVADTVTGYTVKIATVETGASVTMRVNGVPLTPAGDGTYSVPVTGGTTVLEAWVTAPDGVSQRIYRWTTLSQAERAAWPQPDPTEGPGLAVTEAPETMAYGSDAAVSFAGVDVPKYSTLTVQVPAGWSVTPSEQWLEEGDPTASVTVRAPVSGVSGVVRATLTTIEGDTVTIPVIIRLTDPSALDVAGVVAWDSAEPAEGGTASPNGYVTAAVDGNPATYWHTQWQGSSPTHPHQIVLDLGSEQNVASLTYLPRASSDCGGSIAYPACNGQVVEYKISACSGDYGVRTAAQLQGRGFAEPVDATCTEVAAGSFSTANEAKTVTFDQPVATRYLKFESLSAVLRNGSSQPWSSVAELSVKAPAVAQPEPLVDVPLGALIEVSPTTVDAGQTVTVVGAGFAPDASVTLTLGSTSITTTADGQGRISASVQAPAWATDDELVLTATDGTVAGSAAVTVRGVVVPDTTAPAVEKPADLAVTAGDRVSVQVSASDASLPLGYRLVGAPEWLAISGTGLITGTAEGMGSFHVTVVVTDAADNAADVSFTVTVQPKVTQSPSPSVSPSPSPSVSPSPSKSPSVKPTTTPTKPSFVRTAPYTLPGRHVLNGRQWMTVCEDYSQTERCRTEIWATVVKVEDGRFLRESGWAFNNLTYLPFMTRAAWQGNPFGDLGATSDGVFTSAGRQWRTECDTAATGRGACRSYTWTTVYAATPKASGGYSFSQSNQWLFNNIVMFER
ncbi:hypothetical protein GCM10025789_25240 [Tessaracoccus lubricantis]|uniref:F5/8 type C domain-containing protein n=1 Tax=Tessaracoccus lubricantis TaxID=545543 RepID=A0ABP9FJC4_9ACTN